MFRLDALCSDGVGAGAGRDKRVDYRKGGDLFGDNTDCRGLAIAVCPPGC
jgi:hypothetical protein